MTPEPWAPAEELETLAADACCGQLTEDAVDRLETLLGHPRACRWYRDLCLLQAELRILTTADRADAAAQECVRREAQSLAVPVVEIQAYDQQLPPPLVLYETPPSATGFLAHGWPLAYLLATVILLVGIGIGAVLHVSQPVQVAQQSGSVPSPRAPRLPPTMTFVGRITGMVDCQWADESMAAFNGAHVPLGRRYALASGLMEITYQSGARVILQGPCTYEVESKGSGYLSLGMLTARVEKKEERRTKGKEPSASASSFLVPHSYFAVRTPTAVVTDLGTEFGVEVSKEGTTTSHVFQGSVELQTVSADGSANTAARVLHANESARVEKVGQGGECRLTMSAPSATRPEFVRVLPRAVLETLDLVDVVAGGDGFSNRRNAGIDPTNGQVTDKPPASEDFLLVDDGSYHHVEALPLVDGVFVPDGRGGAVQIDSAGHTFADFRTNDNRTSGHLWAGGFIPLPRVMRDQAAILATLGGIDYSSPGHGLLYLHANKGVTFDLDAIRHANPGSRILRFRAVAGNTEPDWAVGQGVFADISVFVDGQARLERRDINGLNGAIWIMIPIADNDRFLTLAVTDGGNGIAADIVIFGDPRLELLKTDNGQTGNLQPKKELDKEDARPD